MTDKLKEYYKGFSFKFKAFLVLAIAVSLLLGVVLFANATGGPTVTITPANGAVISQVKPTITAVMSSGIDNTKTVLKLNGNNVQPTYNSSTNTLTYTPTYDLPDGSYTVDVTVYDPVGNSSETTSTFTIKTSRPTVTKTTPTVGTADHNPAISVEVSDPDQLKSNYLSMKIDGTTVAATFSFQETGYWDTDWDGNSYWVSTGTDYTKGVVNYQASNLAYGTHTVEVSVSDQLNNILNYRWNFDVAPPPTITNGTPAEGSVTNNKLPILSAKINTTPDTGAVDTTSVQVYMDYNLVPSTYDSSTGIVSAMPSAALADGNHYWAFRVTTVKNVTTSFGAHFTIDTVNPTISVFPTTGTVISDATVPRVGFNFSDNNGIDPNSVQIIYDGVSVPGTIQYHEIWDYPPYDDPIFVGYDYTQGTVYYQPTYLDGGVHTVTGSISDKAGNVVSSSTTFKSTVLFSIANMQPTPDSFITNSTPTISYSVTKPANVNFSSLVMKLDNQAVTPVVDQVQGTFTYQPTTPLQEGVHTVYVSLLDTSGTAVTKTWKFTTDANGPTVNLYPADGAVVSQLITGQDKDKIKLDLKDMSGIDESSVQLQVNGVNTDYTLQYKEIWASDPYSDPYVVGYDSTSATIITKNSLPDGNYTAHIIVKDKRGNLTDKTWNFKIGVPPLATSITPMDKSVSNTNTVHFKVVVQDANGPAIDASSAKLYVDDTLVNSTFTALSATSGTVEADSRFNNESIHNAKLVIADTNGNTANITWSFQVNIYGEMPVTPQSCGSCHSIDQYNKHVHSLAPSTEVGAGTAGHGQTGQCGHCHAALQPQDPTYCSYCHGTNDPMGAYPDAPAGSYPTLAGKNCLDCHNKKDTWTGASLTPVVTGYPGETLPTTPVIHNIFGLHNATNTDCIGCHASNLTREHNIRKDANGNPLNCGTCHNSTDPNVVAAIKNKSTDCVSCHGVNANHESVHPDGLDTNCTTCHKSALSTEHLQNPKTQSKQLGCKDCHQSSRPEVQAAIVNGNLNCSACHDKAHTLPLAKVAPKDIPLYPGLNWSDPVAANTWSGESWMPDEFTGTGFVKISNRSNGLTGDGVWNYYNQELITNNGWTLQSSAPAPGSNFYSATFVKTDSFTGVNRKVILNFYGGENHTGSPVAASGYRIELIYK